jgi:hypothetical protein
MRRQATIVVTLALILAAAASATAAPSAKDPSSLLLRRRDLPAKAKYTWGDVPASALGGANGRGAYYQATLPVSSDKFEQISGLVVAAASASQATKLFGQFARQAKSKATGSVTTLRLPAYGNAQLALLQSPKVGSKTDLLVRRNSIVWQLEVAPGGVLVLSKAQLLGELTKYALKQKSRVGNG